MCSLNPVYWSLWKRWQRYFLFDAQITIQHSLRWKYHQMLNRVFCTAGRKCLEHMCSWLPWQNKRKCVCIWWSIIFISLGQIPKSEIARSCGKYIFVGNCQTFPKVAAPSLVHISTSNAWQFQFFLIFTKAWYCQVFFWGGGGGLVGLFVFSFWKVCSGILSWF